MIWRLQILSPMARASGLALALGGLPMAAVLLWAYDGQRGVGTLSFLLGAVGPATYLAARILAASASRGAGAHPSVRAFLLAGHVVTLMPALVAAAVLVPAQTRPETQAAALAASVVLLPLTLLAGPFVGLAMRSAWHRLLP